LLLYFVAWENRLDEFFSISVEKNSL
jgi:hypothetical protein